MSAGIYQIKNDINEKIYVGKAKNLATRWKQHKDDLAKGTHANKYLQMDYDEMGMEVFTYSVLEKVPECSNLDRVLFQKEREWGDKLGARGENGYNITNFYTNKHNAFTYEEALKSVGNHGGYCGITVSEMTDILYHSSYECAILLFFVRATIDSNCCDPLTKFEEDWSLGIWEEEKLAKAANMRIKDLRKNLEMLRELEIIDWFELRKPTVKTYGFFESIGYWNSHDVFVENKDIKKIMTGNSKKWKYGFKKCLLE